MKHPLIFYRELHNLTQADLGEMVGASQSMIAHLEGGTRFASPLLARRLARFTGIDMNEFFCPDPTYSEVAADAESEASA